MKRSCLNLRIIVIWGLCIFMSWRVAAQSKKILSIDSDFKTANLKAYSLINERYDDSPDIYYFGFDNEVNIIDFEVENASNEPVELILELSNALIDEVALLTLENSVYKKITTTGINYPASSKSIEHRLFAFPINLGPLQKMAYRLSIKKELGKPLVTSIFLKSKALFEKQSANQQILIGLYFGISLLSVFFSLFIFYVLKKSSYIIYALYIFFLGLYISSYTGLFGQFFLSENSLFNKYTNYVLFSEISLLLFVIFSQKILEAKTYTPKLKQSLDILLITLVSIRLLIHFLIADYFSEYVSIFMNLWYSIFLIMTVIISIEIFKYFRTNFKRTSLFAIAYLFMISGVVLTLLYHSYGLVNTYLWGLPYIFYSSLLEILFLTFTVILMVKDIYDERNRLSEQIIIQEKKNLTSFIKGEDQERERIGKELHDNIGSKLGFLKRFVADNINNDEVNEAIDDLCNDVRNLSHEISPSELRLVGFENAISDMANKLNSQTEINVEFNSYHFPTSLDDNTELQLYRTIQEALNNVLKHSKATRVDIQLVGHKNEATLTIEDNGIGFNLYEIKNGIGLKNIASRISLINGTVEIDSKKNHGTSILITFPL